MMKISKNSATDGLFKDNTVLSAGMIISPVIICADTLKNSLALVYAFSIITFFSVMIISLLPKKMPYSIKLISSALIGSLIYIPVIILTNNIYPNSINSIGIYFPLIAVNSLIIYQTQHKFNKMRFFERTSSLIFYIIGFSAVMILVGFIRELLAFGTINNNIVDVYAVISGIKEPYGGFIILGIICGIYRKIRSLITS